MILEIIGITFVTIGLLLIIIEEIIGSKNNNFPKKKRNPWNKIAILIPARDESKVIEDLLISIKNQSMKAEIEDVYIIVEQSTDPTIEIAKKYNAKIFIRKKLNLKRKGYALNELIEEIYDKDYDAYFIIDADNVLDKNFFKEMAKTYEQGYDIGISYRSLKNGNDSLIAACSGFTFAFLNSNGNERKSKQSRNVTLSGTGLYIIGNLIKKWQSFPFHSLTEDYETTLYSIENNLTSYYNKNAIFYDEQPTIYKNTINQRIRWIRGYFENRKEYLPKLRKKLKQNANLGSVITELIGMKPYILMIIGVILYIINQLIRFMNSQNYIYLFKIILIFLLIYLIFTLLTAIIMLKERKKINLNKKMQIKTILFSFIFFITYIPCAIKAVLSKEVEWQKVEHTKRWKN